MQVRKKRALGFAAAVAVAGVTLAGCSGATTPEDTAAAVDPDAKVTITVGEMPTSDQPAALDTFKAKVAAFEELHPNITVKGDETRYDVSTFNAMLVGGTLPTTLAVPFTDMKALISRGQAADVTDFIAESKTLSNLNPDLASAAQDADGRDYGIVRDTYTMALIYDRGLYEEAGLDPDAVPTTWAEVLDNAETITAKTGKPGFVLPTTGNVGGWLLTTIAYSNGGLVEKTDGDKTKVTIDTDAMKSSLEFLHDARWTADAAGANFLLGGDDIRNELAGGNVGQTVNGASIYNDLVVNRGMPGERVGIAPLPQAKDGLGALGGGAIQWYNPKATANELAAALKWTEFYSLDRYTNEDSAVEWAETRAADGKPVGYPEVPLFGQKAYDDYLGWIEPYMNVDRENYTAYFDSLSKLPIVPEPAVKAQELYAALDPIVQAVLTREDADIDQLLSDAQTQVQAIVDAG